MTSSDVISQVPLQLQSVKSTAHADPGFQQTKAEVLEDAEEVSLRLFNKVKVTFEDFKVSTFGDPNFEQPNVTIPGLLPPGLGDSDNFYDMEDEARLSAIYSSMYVIRQYLFEMEWDAVRADGIHSSLAFNLTVCRHELQTFMTAINVTIHVLDVQHPGRPSYVMEPDIRDPPSEYMRHIRDFLVLQDFGVAVKRSYFHLHAMYTKYAQQD
ncbi:uncharacterized protein [Branchiostoma lanceolatum]|uniref:uncharacterized protein n=1 Tax=Branchiostoma lanceolatum TaxID=7740 RepID=UPI003451CD76